jgi:hypothetical protein
MDNDCREILGKVKPLAADYYRLSGRPLGITGEIGESEAMRLFPNMTLAAVRNPDFDALREGERVQIKARAVDPERRGLGRMSRIKRTAKCDTVMLVLLDLAFDPVEVWEAPFSKVVEELGRPGKAMERGQLGISKFKTLARRTWSRPMAETP